MSEKIKQPLLSICIPTWNRCVFLQESLQRIYNDFNYIDPLEVELFVSDNCSDDDTPIVVKDFQDRGLPIVYNRNTENIGGTKNFLLCMKHARGKYILLLGDDDFFCKKGLQFILNMIRDKEYGLINICNYPKSKKSYWMIDQKEVFLKKVSFWITFMSGNIFRKDIIELIDEPEKYIDTYLLQVPFFIHSALSQKSNLIINNKGLMTFGVDYKNNGGYNIYEVFVKNYLGIWNAFLEENKISRHLYSFIMKDLYLRFILDFNIKLFILKKDVSDDTIDPKNSRGGYVVTGGKNILFEYYKYKPYFYYSFFIVMWKGFMIFLKGVLKIYLRRG